jgi:hypothetical protein
MATCSTVVYAAGALIQFIASIRTQLISLQIAWFIFALDIAVALILYAFVEPAHPVKFEGLAERFLDW